MSCCGNWAGRRQALPLRGGRIGRIERIERILPVSGDQAKEAWLGFEMQDQADREGSPGRPDARDDADRPMARGVCLLLLAKHSHGPVDDVAGIVDIHTIAPVTAEPGSWDTDAP